MEIVQVQIEHLDACILPGMIQQRHHILDGELARRARQHLIQRRTGTVIDLLHQLAIQIQHQRGTRRDARGKIAAQGDDHQDDHDEENQIGKQPADELKKGEGGRKSAPYPTSIVSHGCS